MTIGYVSAERRAAVAHDAKQCSVLLINPQRASSPHRVMFEALGFVVNETRDWPKDDRAILDYHVVILVVQNIGAAPMLAARLRAKPRFGRRILIALVPASTSTHDRLTARTSGFDDVLTDSCNSRQLTARILRRLRSRPEYHCVLPPADKRRSAA